MIIAFLMCSSVGETVRQQIWKVCLYEDSPNAMFLADK
jgi:hypothetical protein